MECGFWVPAGYSVGCGCGVQHSGTLTGGAQYQALLGWGLLVACCVSRISWELMGICG